MSKQVFEAVLSRGATPTRSLLTKLIVAVVVLCSMAPGAPASGRKSASQEPKFEMGTFYLCLLVKGPKFNPAETPENASWGTGHMKHVQCGARISKEPFDFLSDLRVGRNAAFETRTALNPLCGDEGWNNSHFKSEQVRRQDMLDESLLGLSFNENEDFLHR